MVFTDEISWDAYLPLVSTYAFRLLHHFKKMRNMVRPQSIRSSFISQPHTRWVWEKTASSIKSITGSPKGGRNSRRSRFDGDALCWTIHAGLCSCSPAPLLGGVRFNASHLADNISSTAASSNSAAVSSLPFSFDEQHRIASAGSSERIARRCWQYLTFTRNALRIP